MKMNKTLLLLSFVLISGCMMGPNFQKPEPETPENYIYADTLQADADSVLNLKWWELFNDPVLDTLVNYALENNKNMLIAASRVEEARASLGFIKADIYPRLDLQASAARGNLAGAIKLESASSQYYIAPVLNWEIDFWGKFRRANEAARAQLMASMYSYRTVQISLISEVISTYFMLLDFRRRLEITEHTLESRLHSLDIIQKRYDKGIIPEIDLNQSQIQKEIAAASIPATERLIATTENALSILLGTLPTTIQEGDLLEYQFEPPDIPMGIPSTLLERRPDVVEAEYLFKAQNARIGVAEAMRFPAFNLTGIYGLASQDLSKLTTEGNAWSVSGSLFGPLFNFNKTTLRVEIEEERTKQALFNYENTVLFAFRDVEDALVSVDTYKRELAAIHRKFLAAKNANTLSKERYDKGVTSYLEVLEMERTLFTVELELSALKQQYYNAYVKLYKALGGGWISEEEMKQAENPTEE